MTRKLFAPLCLLVLLLAAAGAHAQNAWLAWRGDWKASANYGAADVALHGDILYLGLENSSGLVPALHPAEWSVLAEAKAATPAAGHLAYAGTYAGGTAYIANDVVVSSVNLYVALGATTGNAPSSSPTKWALLAGPNVILNPTRFFQWQGAWAAPVPYLAGVGVSYEGDVWKALTGSFGVTPVEGTVWTKIAGASATLLPRPTRTAIGGAYAAAACPGGQHVDDLDPATGALHCSADTATPPGGVSGDLQKNNGSGGLAAASAGSDYLAPTGNGSGLTSVDAATLQSHAASYFQPALGYTPLAPANALSELTGAASTARSNISAQLDLGALTKKGTGTALPGCTFTTEAAGDRLQWDGTKCVNAEPGIAYNADATANLAILAANKGKLLTRTNAAMADTIAQAGTGAFDSLFYFFDKNIDATHAQAITPATSTVNGAASVTVLPTGGGMWTGDGAAYNFQYFMPADPATGKLAHAALPTLATGDMTTAVNTRTVTVTLDSPVTGDSGHVIVLNPATAIHITRAFCSVYAATNVVVNLDKRAEGTYATDSGAHLLGSDLTAVTGGANTSTFSNTPCGGTSSCAVAAHTPVVLTITSVSGTPASLGCSVDYTVD
jgi:hypothetical protein